MVYLYGIMYSIKYKYGIWIVNNQLITVPLNVEFDSTAAVPVIKKKTNIVVIIHLQPKVVDAEVVET